MILRYIAAFAAAAVVTLGLFYLMQSLVARDSGAEYERQKRTVFDFVRLKRDERVERKKREKPRKIERKEPPPPAQMPVAKLAKAPIKQALKVDAPPFRPNVALAGDPHLGGSVSDSDIVPLVRPLHRYPSRAQARGIEGWVHLRFDVTPDGGTDNIVILDADPQG
ncbi:MAG TPA: TonB family protein, partial [Chromatiales bacterium]|nr:TonB family protein [Chromatiales bacterium]